MKFPVSILRVFTTCQSFREEVKRAFHSEFSENQYTLHGLGEMAFSSDFYSFIHDIQTLNYVNAISF